MALARIGLGSNIGDATRHVETALAALGELGVVRVRSSLYRTPAWGVTDQPDFINAAALLETTLGPRALLLALQALEVRLGRTATYRWGPRTIDLDILAYDDLVLTEADLTIPHERLHERAFALGPLAEIDPTFARAYAALPEAERDAVQRIPDARTRNRSSVIWDETLERVRSAAEFCASAGLTRFRLEETEFAIEIRRAPRAVRSAAPPDFTSEDGEATVGAANGNGAVAHEEVPKTVLKAEFVGIVRLSRPSVAPGSIIGEDRELAFVEALGIRNPIRSGGPGRIADVYVTDGQPVEYGQALFAIEK
ncbi:MAG: 2-amino-4-hydroxy-6-hydroxymethyldihydropteridine diphosphokinase [Candidatus Eremiobacteraeota bacterium]|nr:2-amino-4-hydroxy-6-hydroxymethyldihydropteridine diphosphokinase [Candidatus Eremiobacteraeota bacterium]